MIGRNVWYSERESNPHGPYGPQDFKSGVSTYSTIRARIPLNGGCKNKN